MTDRVFRIEGDWALGSDGVQWMLMRRHIRTKGDTWDPVSFVRSTKDILARCMREKGLEPGTAVILLSGLSDSLEEWKSLHATPEAI